MPIFTPPKIDYLLVKVAARCNINCNYCYWFSDKSVYQKPKVMEPLVYRQLIDRIAEQVEEYRLTKFSLLFHGGEPTLWGTGRFSDFVEMARQKVPCPITYSMTTNGVLVDDAWAERLKEFGVAVTVSIDGPAAIHDNRRKAFDGRGTSSKAIEAFHRLRRAGVRTSALAVCDPLTDPDEICQFFVEELQTSSFDVLIPEANYDRPPEISIASYYTRLFDLWLDRYGPRGVSMRLPRALAVAAFGGDTHLESLGYGAQQTSTVLTDGSLEPLDVLRYAGTSHTQTSLNIFTNKLQQLVDEQLWREVFNNSLDLPSACRSCEYRDACGGGYAPHRYSTENRYDNPSIYCADYKLIFSHVFRRLNDAVSIQLGDNIVSPLSITNGQTASDTACR